MLQSRVCLSSLYGIRDLFGGESVPKFLLHPFENVIACHSPVQRKLISKPETPLVMSLKRVTSPRDKTKLDTQVKLDLAFRLSS